jgi:hypothetical protein
MVELPRKHALAPPDASEGGGLPCSGLPMLYASVIEPPPCKSVFAVPMYVYGGAVVVVTDGAVVVGDVDAGIDPVLPAEDEAEPEEQPASTSPPVSNTAAVRADTGDRRLVSMRAR